MRMQTENKKKQTKKGVAYGKWHSRTRCCILRRPLDAQLKPQYQQRKHKSRLISIFVIIAVAIK